MPRAASGRRIFTPGHSGDNDGKPQPFQGLAQSMAERTVTFLKSLRLDGFLSIAPGSEAISLLPLNVLIGPNGVGKSNFIEAIELLHVTPTGFAQAIRDGGGAQEWLWRGSGATKAATIETVTAQNNSIPALRYRMEFTCSGQRTEVTDEAIEEVSKRHAAETDVFFYYRYRAGRPVINIKEPASATSKAGWSERPLARTSLVPDESVLFQRKDPDLYPELTWLGQQFGKMQTFREWSFGRYGALRQPQPAELPGDMVSGDARNLGLMLNELEHTDAGPMLNKFLGRFLPRYQRFSTRTQGGNVQLYLHEEGPGAIPAPRLSDGNLRFLTLLALLLSPAPPPLICIDEPELGLHPDALVLLAELMVSASERTQLFVTTHSDALVSALTPQAGPVLVSEYLGGTRMRRVEPDSLKGSFATGRSPPLDSMAAGNRRKPRSRQRIRADLCRRQQLLQWTAITPACGCLPGSGSGPLTVPSTMRFADSGTFTLRNLLVPQGVDGKIAATGEVLS